MIDTWRAQSALTRLDRAIGFPRDEDVSKYLSEVEYEIGALECEEEHCDDEHGDLIDPVGARSYIRAKLSRIRLGIYSEERDGSLLEVLEEIEGMIR
ncbi:hypothetical protein SEA_LIFES_59 [Microbacterium phage Lifes]|nr:hypothetical protein SEA_LIFES_59 [Microbacterium phage Lifes]